MASPAKPARVVAAAGAAAVGGMPFPPVTRPATRVVPAAEVVVAAVGVVVPWVGRVGAEQAPPLPSTSTTLRPSFPTVGSRRAVAERAAPVVTVEVGEREDTVGPAGLLGRPEGTEARAAPEG